MRLSQEDGTAALEFAMVLPLLVLLVFGITEFGRALYSKEILTNGTREGSRFGIVLGDPRPTTQQIADVVVNYLTNAGLNTGNVSVASSGGSSGCGGDLVLTITGAGGPSGSDLSVRADYPLSLLVLPSLSSLSNMLCLSAETVMKLE